MSLSLFLSVCVCVCGGGGGGGGGGGELLCKKKQQKNSGPVRAKFHEEESLLQWIRSFVIHFFLLFSTPMRERSVF